VPNRPVSGRSRRTRILIIGEHAIYRAALRRLLEREHDFAVVGAAADWTEAFERVERCAPDIALVDLGGALFLPNREILRRISARGAAARVLVMAPHMPQSAMTDALRRGVRGIVAKGSTAELFIKSIRAVASGHYWVGRAPVDDVVAMLVAPPARAVGAGPGDNFRLTKRELDMVSLLRSGFPNRRIADQCAISQRTVRHHLTNIFEKLGVSSRLELVLFAMQHGLAVTEASDVSALARPAAIGPSSDPPSRP
jgi:two-component system nitrate/nitrite response regulator NarL